MGWGPLIGFRARNPQTCRRCRRRQRRPRQMRGSAGARPVRSGPRRRRARPRWQDCCRSPRSAVSICNGQPVWGSSISSALRRSSKTSHSRSAVRPLRRDPSWSAPEGFGASTWVTARFMASISAAPRSARSPAGNSASRRRMVAETPMVWAVEIDRDAVIGGPDDGLDGLAVARLADDHRGRTAAQGRTQPVGKTLEVPGDLRGRHQRAVSFDMIEHEFDRRLVGLDAPGAALQQPPRTGGEQGGLARARHSGHQGQAAPQIPCLGDLVLDAECLEARRRAGQHPERDVDGKSARGLHRGEVAAEAPEDAARLGDGVGTIDGPAATQDAFGRWRRKCARTSCRARRRREPRRSPAPACRRPR